MQRAASALQQKAWCGCAQERLTQVLHFNIQVQEEQGLQCSWQSRSPLQRALRCRKVAGTPTETPDWAMQQELRKRLEEMLSWSLLLPHKEKLLKQLNPSTSFPEDGGFLFFQQFPTFITLKMTLKGFVLRNLNSPFGVTCKQEHKSAPVCLRWISLILSKEFVFPYPVYNANV